MKNNRPSAKTGYEVDVNVLRVEKLGDNKSGLRYRLHCSEGMYLTEAAGKDATTPRLTGKETGKAVLFVEGNKIIAWRFGELPAALTGPVKTVSEDGRS